MNKAKRKEKKQQQQQAQTNKAKTAAAKAHFDQTLRLFTSLAVQEQNSKPRDLVKEAADRRRAEGKEAKRIHGKSRTIRRDNARSSKSEAASYNYGFA